MNMGMVFNLTPIHRRSLYLLFGTRVLNAPLKKNKFKKT